MSEKTLAESWWDSLRNVGNVARAGLGATEEGDAERLHVAATRALIAEGIQWGIAARNRLPLLGEGLTFPEKVAIDVLPDRTEP